MPNLLDIRRRLKSVKNTQQITKAMKMVSAAKLKRAQTRVVTARPFANKMTEVLGGLADRTDENFHHPLLDARGDERYLLVLVTADKGLCGAFNTNLIKAGQAFVAKNPDKQIEVLPVGRKGRDFFRRRGASLAGEYIGVTGKGRVDFSEALDIARDIIKRFTEDEGIDKVFIIYNEFRSVLQQRVVTEQLLPVAGTAQAKDVSVSQESAHFIYRIFKAAHGNLPGKSVPLMPNELLSEAQQFQKNPQAFLGNFVERSRFASAFPTSLTPAHFVDSLFVNAGVVPGASERTAVIGEFGATATTTDSAARARAIRRVAESSTYVQQESMRAAELFKAALSNNAGAVTTDQPLTLVDYIYEQPPAEIFSQLLPRLVETQIFRALLESVASEQGARMTAMDSASKNARELIDSLTLNMNRVRQAAITNEIIEVVSGAAAL